MEFRLLGPIEARRDSELIPLDGAKQKTVLAALLLARGHILSDDRLSALLWGDEPPATSSAQIYTYVSRLRKYLGDGVVITRRPPGYLMTIGRSTLDHEDFRRLSRLGRLAMQKGLYHKASEHFQEALSLWRGPALGNVTEFLAEAELPRLEEERMTVLNDRIEAQLALGEEHHLIPELTGLVAEHPLRERLRAQLMIALYRTGRQADALAAYHAGRQLLADELGVDPGAALRETYLAILTNEPTLDSAPYPVRANGGDQRLLHPIPPEVGEFAGRDAELTVVTTALTSQEDSAPSVIQISGMAGVGKSALALRAAYAVREHFPDGQLEADLITATGVPVPPEEVVRSFLRAFGLTDEEIPDDVQERFRLYRSLTADRRMLIILKHAVSHLHVAPLLPSGPHCRAIITARRDLPSLTGAYIIRLRSLGEEAALAMLTGIIGAERVAAEPEAARRIAGLCGGLPLALYVVGARLRAKPRWLLGLASRRLDTPHRLDELSHGYLDVRSRIHSAYLELDDDCRRAFVRLALLDVREFTAQTAALALSLPENETEELLDGLLDARMLEVSACSRTGHFRYRFHELFRLFAHERLDDHKFTWTLHSGGPNVTPVEPCLSQEASRG